MANYDPNRPRPLVDAAAALPGDALGTDPPQSQSQSEPQTPPAGQVGITEHSAEHEADPAPGTASRLLPRQAEPVDRRLLAIFGGVVAIGWLVAAGLVWWLWRRRPGRC